MHLDCLTQGRLVRNGCECLIQGRLVRSGCECLTQGRLVRSGCECLTQGRLVRSGCDCLTQGRLVRSGCDCLIQGRLVRSGCECLTQGRLVRSGCDCLTQGRLVRSGCDCLTQGRLVRSGCSRMSVAWYGSVFTCYVIVCMSATFLSWLAASFRRRIMTSYTTLVSAKSLAQVGHRDIPISIYSFIVSGFACEFQCKLLLRHCQPMHHAALAVAVSDTWHYSSYICIVYRFSIEPWSCAKNGHDDKSRCFLLYPY